MRTLKRSDLKGVKATVMGLGLNGGGLASARFLAQAGAEVTVTDMKDEAALAPSLAALDGLNIRFVLGRHDLEDFRGADLVVKNPAVRPDSPYLMAAKRVESDMSIFLALCPAPVFAVTGSKGKSTTSSALDQALRASGLPSYLGGNITVSPFSFLDELTPRARVVLELSSWQLGDLKGMGVLKPKAAVLTLIVPDHLDRYGTMEAYVADKRLIYADQGPEDWTVCNADDPYGHSFAAETRARPLFFGKKLPEGTFGAAIRADGSAEALLPGMKPFELVPAEVRLPGAHSRYNLAAAGLAAWAAGADPAAIARGLAEFGGVEHRLELFLERDGVSWCNDSAATVPEAVAAALSSFDRPIVLITGGTDKVLDFKPHRKAYAKAKRLVLLRGTGTDKLKALLDEDGIGYEGPYDDIRTAVARAKELAEPGSVAMLSPGCTSFGMFKNEFDRGRSFKEAVLASYAAGS
jgi:UDP-N-acetylmuramoylalanine--D-glutamate ligase